jgi:hypothetical protein
MYDNLVFDQQEMVGLLLHHSFSFSTLIEDVNVQASCARFQ